MNITINVVKEEVLKSILQITDEELSREDNCQEYIDDLVILKISLNRVVKYW